MTAPDSTLGTSVTWYMDVSEYLRVSLAIALGGHVLDKGAVVWYAAVRTQWQLCQGNMLLDAMVCLANHGHQHDLLVAPLFF